MKNSTAPQPSFSSLPDEIIVNCLARVSKSQYGSLSLVSKSFHSLLSSPEIYAARSQLGATEPRLYLCCDILSTATTRSHRWWYNLRTLRNCDEERIKKISEIKIKSELSLIPAVKLSSCPRLNETVLAVGSDIYQLGGIKEKDKPSRSVRVFDCRSHTQRRAPMMRVARQCAKACVLDGRIYVMGGCIEKKECWGEVFDVKTQTWNKELVPSPSGEDEFDCNFEVLVLGARIYVITEHKKYVYDLKEGRWLLLETGFSGLECVLKIGTVWCVLDNRVLIKELCNHLWWYDVGCDMWFEVKGLSDLLWDAKVNCRSRMIQLVNYGGKVVIVWVVLPDVIIYRRNKPPIIHEEKICFAVIRLEKRLTSSGLAISGEIEQLNCCLVNGSYKPLTCLSVSL